MTHPATDPAISTNADPVASADRYVGTPLANWADLLHESDAAMAETLAAARAAGVPLNAGT